MNSPENLARLKNIKCLLLDMDGTFYTGNHILPGSLEFLAEIKKKDIRVLFLTNNSSRSANFYIKKLIKLGVEKPFLNVLTSGQAIGEYALKHFPNQRVYLLANQIVTDEMTEIGLLIDNQNPEYVLITYDTELTYEKLDRVCYFIRAGLPYIASHPDFNCPTEYGFAPDIGATIAYIEASTGRRPDAIIGKPNSLMIDQAIEIVNQAIVKSEIVELTTAGSQNIKSTTNESEATTTMITKSEIAMIGDRLYTDIEAAIQSNILGILVMSGETDRQMLLESTIKPDLVFDTLFDIVPYLD
ncbi:MAG TPA: HAD-IIA family hydrolase [Clostridiaceae bacterium]|nr:HAD-IIA family hydrolase [Clostridiaceae bacterium]